jgi:hypothetical protein
LCLFTRAHAICGTQVDDALKIALTPIDSLKAAGLEKPGDAGRVARGAVETAGRIEDQARNE